MLLRRRWSLFPSVRGIKQVAVHPFAKDPPESWENKCQDKAAQQRRVSRRGPMEVVSFGTVAVVEWMTSAVVVVEGKAVA